MEVTKNICCTKGKVTVNHSTVNRWFKKFSLGSKNLNDQTRWGTPKPIESEAMLQAKEVNLAIIKWVWHLTVQ